MVEVIAEKTKTTNKVKQFDHIIKDSYPSSLRRQLWPLCCGASILSGLKEAHKLTEDQLVADILSTINDCLPDLQVFAGEQMKPALTFLTLNNAQMGSPKIINAITTAGFVKIGESKPRGSLQGFYVKDTSGTYQTC